MANTRLYKIERLDFGGDKPIGGIKSHSINPSYALELASSADGAVGQEDFDVAGLMLAVNFLSTDVQVGPTIIGELGDLLYVLSESGVDTFFTSTIANLLITQLGYTFSQADDAAMTVGGVARAATDTTVLSHGTTGILAPEAGVLAAAIDAFSGQNYPLRLFRPQSASFTPTPTNGGVPITIAHVQGLTINMTANVIQDSSGDEVAHAAVDIVNWNLADVSLTFRENTVASDQQKVGDLLLADQGALTVPVLARGGGTDKTVTVNGLKFASYTENDGDGYTDFTINGKASFRLSAGANTEYTAATLVAFG